MRKRVHVAAYAFLRNLKRDFFFFLFNMRKLPAGGGKLEADCWQGLRLRTGQQKQDGSQVDVEQCGAARPLTGEVVVSDAEGSCDPPPCYRCCCFTARGRL